MTESQEAERDRVEAATTTLDSFAPAETTTNGGAVVRESVPLTERRVVLETQDVTKRFAGITAVDGVSIQLHEGEILGIIGPNGAGKTTLFDLISGFLLPDEGTVLLEDRNVTRMRPQKRAMLGLARSFQDARLFGALTVHETICVALDRPLQVWDPVPAMFSIPAISTRARSSRSAPTSSSRSWASTTTATSSCPTSPPAAGASSTSPARSGSSPR